MKYFIVYLPNFFFQLKFENNIEIKISKNNTIEIEEVYEDNGIEKGKENARLSTSTSETDRPSIICRQNAGTGKSLLKRLRSGVDNLDLQSVLKNSCSGQAILNDYKKNSILTTRSRNSLVTIIIYYFLDKSM